MGQIRYCEPAAQVLAVALGAEVLVAVGDDLAAREHGVDVAVDLEPLPRGVIHVHVVRLLIADRGVAGRVVDHDVGIRPRTDHALAAVQPEHARRGRRGDLDPALERDEAVDDATEEQVHAVLDRADAVGDLGEVAEAELFLILHAERAVVSGDHLDVVGAQALPHVIWWPSAFDRSGVEHTHLAPSKLPHSSLFAPR